MCRWPLYLVLATLRVRTHALARLRDPPRRGLVAMRCGAPSRRRLRILGRRRPSLLLRRRRERIRWRHRQPQGSYAIGSVGGTHWWPR